MARTDTGFMLRMPAKMRERIGELAKENMRSMNSEIVFRLAQALGFQGVTAAGPSPGKADPAAVPDETGSRPAHRINGN